MTEFLGSTLKAHTDAFDHLIEQTDAALSHPKVIEGLGEIATRLRQANSELIFPNIIDGRIEVPESKRETNSAMLLPLLSTDHAAATVTGLGLSALRPTPRRQAWLQQRIGTIDSSLDPAAFIDHDHALLGRRLNDVTLSHLHIHRGMTISAVRDMFPDTPSLYSSRPLIFTTSEVSRGDTPFIGHVVAHELSHAEEREVEEKKATIKETAERELRGYHVGYTILKAYHPSMDKRTEKKYKKTIQVEQLRAEHTNPATPFKTTPVLTKKLKDIGVLD